uniref:Uncharacterized protein n=1 Tax=Tanacetum cinerariifolium TaxID=118510 RepID=A0A6L2KXW7_TANCI|nr:hypothetical protein [Tanacetum cinerariifolium]
MQIQTPLDKAPICSIQNQQYDDPEQEKTRNRFCLSVLMEVDTQNYQRARFTSEATIDKINANVSCSNYGLNYA